jgi:peroxiredoxin-like protein
MQPFPHRYDVHLSGGPSGYAELSTPGVLGLQTAPPADFGGPGDAWSPEHLLLASVQACFLFTFRAVARASKLEFTSLTLEASGTVDRSDGVTRFTEIVLRPRLTLASGADRDRARHALEKSERACLVSASLSTPVRLEPEIDDE